MSTPQAKRRRLNEATKTLHKPFKSPFRTPLKVQQQQSPSHESASSDPPSEPDVTSTTSSFLSTTPVLSSTKLPSRPNPPNLTPRTQQVPKSSKPFTASTSPTNPSVAKQILQLRSEIQILTQAHALLTSSKDKDLEREIEMWRTASREVAEDLFATTRERVQRMGGVGAWKDREREQKEWRAKWEKEDAERELEERRRGMEENGEEREVYDDYADLGDAVDEKKGEDDSEDKANDDDGFTMDMMLKTLNIDLNLIGYNKEFQRWEG
ncbi:hypothetical protein BU24DRAFT_449464 [Aaosphaeria arxii CBS 175.79]|uniref:DNA repair protein Dds20/Mei5 n=1 Tax=Aaosphaeria arxii CBS 175.79 TaxID=1450172 RepID=A0A6A5XX20_9PLEO|nr:uncharacterized protein BU24DRAFT_449464 [Aaosphaeria arxii CBS 175.79]KAF2017885.1 hypothetical protein BU24DRAFT_449464 [Aaosphaeria arxii CBS 175.79]